MTAPVAINKEFANHVLNDHGVARSGDITHAFDTLLNTLLHINPDASREMSLVRTKLEEASFYARKALALNPVHQKVGNSSTT